MKRQFDFIFYPYFNILLIFHFRLFLLRPMSHVLILIMDLQRDFYSRVI